MCKSNIKVEVNFIQLSEDRQSDLMTFPNLKKKLTPVQVNWSFFKGCYEPFTKWVFR